jgi:hypothetical protein
MAMSRRLFMLAMVRGFRSFIVLDCEPGSLPAGLRQQ